MAARSAGREPVVPLPDDLLADDLVPAWPDRRHRLDETAARISRSVDGDTVCITLVTGDGEFLDTFGAHNPNPEIESAFRESVGARTRVGDGYTTRGVATGEPVFIPDADEVGLRDKAVPKVRSFFDRFPVMSLLAVPIKSDGRVVGMLHALRHKPSSAYTDADIERLERIADRLGASIAKSSLPDELRLDAKRTKQHERNLFPLADSMWGIALAVLLPLLLSVFLGLVSDRPPLPSALYLAAVVVVAGLSGRNPALIASLLSILGLWFVVLPPKNSFLLDDPSDVWGLVLFAAATFVVVWMVQRLEKGGKHLADALEDEATARERELAAEIAVRNEQARADSRFRSLVEATTSLVWSTDSVGAFAAPQGAWEAYTGQRWDEQAGFGWVRALHEDDRDAFMTTWRLAIANAVEFQARGRLWHQATKTHRWFVARSVPIRDNAGDVSEWIGTMTDVHEVHQAQAESDRMSAMLEALTEQAPVGFGFLDGELRYQLVNEELAAMNGRPPDEHLGRRPDEVDPDLDPGLGAAMKRVLDNGVPVVDREVNRSGPDGDRQRIVNFYPVRTQTGDVLGLGTTVVDVTERNRLLDELAELRHRFDALIEADVLAIFSGEDDRITEANGAFLTLIGYDREALNRGRLRWPELTPPGWEAADSRALEQLRTTGRAEPYEKEYLSRDGTTVPIMVGIAALSQQPFRWTAYAADLTERKAAEDLLAAALADRDRVARTLQASLLPPELPPMPGVVLEARYLASRSGGGIGGDFYDVFRTGEHDWNVVIGDVCGKGVEAAALTALARHTLRAAAIEHVEPEAILGLLNEALLRADTSQRFCTTAFGRLSPIDSSDRWRLTLALGGHHQPRLLRDGELRPIGEHGSLVGVFEKARFPSVSVELQQGDQLVWFTDGLIEQPGQRFTERDLERVLSDLGRAGASAAEIAARLTEHAGDDASREDDVAMVVMHFTDPEVSVSGRVRSERSIELPADATSVRVAREFVMAGVHVDPHTTDIIQLLVSELASNAVLHAATPFTVAVHQTERLMRVEVSDSSTAAPVPSSAPIESPTGRGLRIVDSLADAWGVEWHAVGKSVWFEVNT